MDKKQKYKEKNIQTFVRPQHMWIGTEITDDIYMPECMVQLYLKHDTVYLKKDGETSVFHNGKNTDTDHFTISEGDTLKCPDYQITFFHDKLEIECEKEFEAGILPAHREEAYFPGFPVYKRSPRVIYQEKSEKVEIKVPPAKRSMSKGSLAQLIIPSLCMLAFTIAMGIFMKRGAYVYMSAGMTVITLIFSVQKYVSERKETKAENKKRIEVYETYLLNVHKKIRRLRQEERITLDYQNPDISKLESMLTGYSSRIYERTALDDDFLQLNLGYRTGASKIEVSFADKELSVEKDELTETARNLPKEYEKISRIPVTIDLKKAHLGLVGSKENIHEQIKLLLVQLTFFQSYHDLQIVFVHGESYAEEFSYVKWYPHLRIKSINAVAEISNEQIRDQILGSIQQMLKDRKSKQEEEKQETVFLPHFLFIIDEPKMVLNHAIMEYLQSRKMDMGFSIIYTTDQKESLPENVKSICLLQNSTDGLLLMENGVRKNESFHLQSSKGIHLEDMARALGALQHEQGISSKIPESITFFDMYGIEHPEELNIRKRWEKNQSHKSLAVPLGLRAEDDIVELNLHEKAHGPHGLVAGTTGSGKSEIVQSYILSLAVNFHPHEVGFLLIDYKGGGMANLFKNLPHLLGTITNLDKAESMRAMASIKSELSRRQRIFSECDVNHINGYNKLFKLGKVEEPLPHLFMISDEFAELKKEQPEFMAELISTARIGRSLGIHLILATQKPSGVVDDQIWTNSKFRLCLKVQNAGDSKEMLKTPDAANITQAGRAYLQVGNNEIYELFQSAWSGAAYDADDTEEEKEDDRVYLVNALGQGELLNKDLSGTKKGEQLKETQLDAVARHIHEIYAGMNEIMVRRTWLPSLESKIVSPHMNEIKDTADFPKLDMEARIGIVDIPEEQRQEEYTLDFVKNGHFLYMASSGYGKSMLLTNIIMSLCVKNSVENFNCYILDLGNNAMIALKTLPQVADYMSIDDNEKLNKFQKLILDEISLRKKKMAQAMVQNFSLYNEMQQEPLKGILIAIDNYDAISELGDQMLAFVQKVARDGMSLGIYLAVTMTRDNVMRSAVKSNFKEKMAGFNFEPTEINAFIGRSNMELPEEIKGRALAKLENINLLQLYTPVDFEQEVEYIQHLRHLIEEISSLSTEEKAKGIPVLPETLNFSELSQYPKFIQEPNKIPVGLDTESLEVIYLELGRQAGFIIGESGMGRTNQLRSAMKHIGSQRVYLFDSKKGDLCDFSQMENVLYASNADMACANIDKLESELETRKEEYEEARIDDAALRIQDYVKTLEPCYIVIDIIQDLYESLESQKQESRLDSIEEAIQWGIFTVITSDAGTFRDQRNRLLMTLKASKEGIVVGNAKNQSIFSTVGIRDNNVRPDIGHYFKTGKSGKVKFIEN